jgi:hypothetical protein
MAARPEQQGSEVMTAARAQSVPSPVGWRRVLGVARSGWAAIPILATLIGIGVTARRELINTSPTARRAALSNLTLDRNVSFGQYLDRIELPRRPYTTAQLGRKGIYLEFDISVTGYHGKRLPLRWILLDKATHDLVDQGEALRITPRAEHDDGTWFTWVEIPRAARKYVIRLQLYDDQVPARPLARLDSHAFRLST